MNREQKAAVIEEIASQLSAAQAVFAVDYRGLSVTQLRDANTAFRVVKNSLTERAADKAGAESLKALLEGPTALALVEGDAALAAKALSDTARTLRLLEFKGGVMDGNALSAEDVRAIARLPAREVLHGQLVGVVAAPLSGLARTLNALLAGVAVALQQVVDQGLVGGGESPAPADPSDQAPAAPSDAVPPTEQSESDERPAEAGE
jgi:large subunit ribosomal protein L10